MSEKQTTILSLERDVAEEVRERRWEIYDERYPEDMVTEIADSHVPIYNHDRVECLLSDLSLAEPDDPGLIDTDNINIFDILGVTIYERLSAAAYETWEEVREEMDALEDVCKECTDCREDCEFEYDIDRCDRICSKCQDRIDDGKIREFNGRMYCDGCWEDRECSGCTHYVECEDTDEVCDKWEDDEK